MAFAAAAVVSLIVAGAATDVRLDAFLGDLQRACARNDRRAIAAMVQYPLMVFAQGWSIPVKDRAAFLQSYDAFFTEDVRDAIAGASTNRRLEPNAAFLSFGNVLRVKQVAGRFRVIGIVMPAPSQRLRAARRETLRVTFPPRQGVAAYAGSLAAGERESYVVRVRRNELLEVRIDGIAGRAVVAHVSNASTGAPLDARAREGTRVWAGRVPETDDYRIDVVRAAAAGDPVLIYRLSVSLR